MALTAIAVAGSWAGLTIVLLASDRGFAYWTLDTRDDAAQDIGDSGGIALSAAALVFAGLAFVGGLADSGRLADLLVLALACFVLQYSSSFWPWSFSHQIAGDAFHWTGLALFLTAVHEFALRGTTGQLGTLTIGIAGLVIGVMSLRATYAHWHNAVALAKANRPAISEPARTDC